LDPEAISKQFSNRVQRTLEVVAKVPADRRSDPGVVDDWSLKDVMAHLAYWDGVNRYEMETEQAGGTILSDDRDEDVINAEAHQARKDWTWDQVMAEVNENSKARTELLKLASKRDMTDAGSHWVEHREQIEAWIAENL
jgi:hypothetical protein